MSTQELLGIVLTSLSIVALVAGAVKWYIDTKFEPVKCAIEDIQKETKTNGGSSMRDEIKSIKSSQADHISKQEKMDQKIDHMYDVLLEYVARSK